MPRIKKFNQSLSKKIDKKAANIKNVC